MAIRRYRRKLRTNVLPENMYNVIHVNNTITCELTSNSTIIQIQNYFYDVLDSIINHLDFTNSIVLLKGIIQKISSKIDLIKLLELIENNFLSIVMNICDNTNSTIIETRISYIKTFISELPNDCTNFGEISGIIMGIVDSIIIDMDFSKAIADIQKIQLLLNSQIVKIDKLKLIQDNLLDVICNISENTTTEIIRCRIDFIKELITKL